MICCVLWLALGMSLLHLAFTTLQRKKKRLETPVNSVKYDRWSVVGLNKYNMTRLNNTHQ